MNNPSAWMSAAILSAFAPVGPVQAQDFNGFYAGANAGIAIGKSSARTTTVFSPTGYFASTSPGAIAAAGDQTLKSTRFTGGVQGGFNASFRKWLFGLESDIGYMHLKDSASKSGTYPCCAPTGFTVAQSINTDWLFTLRPRVGYTLDSVLLYGTGGLAVTKLTFHSTFSDTFATAAESLRFARTVAGWSYGGGVEVKAGKRWSLRGEFLRLDFSKSEDSSNLTAFTPPISFPTNVFTHTFDLKANLIRVGALYFF